MSPIRLVHLSDIHFSRPSGIGFDPDAALRSDLVSDAQCVLEQLEAAADAIIVSGDIAYSGQKCEYDDVARWLDTLCKGVGCSQEAVYVCPGNHDINRRVLQDNILLTDAQSAVRTAPSGAKRNEALRKRLTDTSAQSLFFSPLSEFNEFAVRYECSFFANKESYAWTHDLELGDGSVLRLLGLNSVLLSGLSDEPGTLFLGDNAYSIPNQPGVEYLTICHHPPNWLLDGSEFDSALSTRARVQLFGHDHQQRIFLGRDYVKVFAGAVHPDRNDLAWKPGYNIIELDVHKEGLVRTLDVKVHVREWQLDPPHQFRALEDRYNNRVHEQRIRLSGWNVTPPDTEMSMITNDGAVLSTCCGNRTDETKKQMSRRELVHRFFRLSTSQKSAILGRLKLLDEPEERLLPDVERFKRALIRAAEQKLLAQIEQAVEAGGETHVRKS